MTQIADNAGADGGIVAEKVAEGKGNFGYNAATGVYEDLVKAGVVDPTKVTRTALQNAASVATLLLTSDALVADKPKDKEAGRAGRAAARTCISGRSQPRPSPQTIHIRSPLPIKLFQFRVALRFQVEQFAAGDGHGQQPGNGLCLTL